MHGNHQPILCYNSPPYKRKGHSYKKIDLHIHKEFVFQINNMQIMYEVGQDNVLDYSESNRYETEFENFLALQCIYTKQLRVPGLVVKMVDLNLPLLHAEYHF